MTTKQEIEKAVAELPDDATIDEAMGKLRQLIEVEGDPSEVKAGESSSELNQLRDE